MSLLVPYTTFFTVDPKSIFLFYDILTLLFYETILDFNVVFYYIQIAQISFFNNHRGIPILGNILTIIICLAAFIAGSILYHKFIKGNRKF